MAGAGEEQAAPAPPPPHLDPPMDDEAPAGKLRRLEQHRRVGEEPYFRMENLPEEIQPVVMSLLTLKEAVRTSIVARSWRMLWSFHSNLCFYGPNNLDYDSDEYHGGDKQAIDDFIKIKRDKFIEDVNWVIQRHSGVGINKFSIRCGLHKEDFDHLHRWIAFAASSKAKVIEFDLKIINGPSKEVHHFPLEALDVQGNSFVQSLFLADVFIKPHSDIRGFTILRKLVLEYVQMFGDLPGLLANCSALEDLAIIQCSGVANLSIPRKLDKLQHLLIDRTNVVMVEFQAAHLAHFEYKGHNIPIVLHGCSELEKATIKFTGSSKGLGRVFTVVPSILPVKILDVQADIYGYEQLQKLTTVSRGMFTRLRHMTCQLNVHYNTNEPNADNGVLQVAHCLNVAPHLETLHLHMAYLNKYGQASHELNNAEEESSPMRRHDHLKTVYMSGFRLYKAQKKLACSILESASVLEHMQLEPRVAGVGDWAEICYFLNDRVEKKFVPQVCEWARLTSLRFGKVVSAAVDAPLQNE
uniref:Uncharacterized protein n=1 Tax=Avena sativa TaxID=4498 RepID=A0ACD5Z8P3_AVESA